MQDRELVETLKIRALPEGSDDYENLVEFLRLYHDAAQLVVNRLRVLNKTPSVSALHRVFYSELS